MKWDIEEICLKKSIEFSEKLDLKEELMKRSSEILDISEVNVTGTVSYEAPLYSLLALAKFTLVLASTRSLVPVEVPMEIDISEVYSASESFHNGEVDDEDIDDGLILTIEDAVLSLDEAVADNILLSIPLRVLSEDEEKSEELPQGDFWQVLSEEEYEKLKEEKKEENSPFSALSGLFDENSEKI